jgi:asparagine synthase (glutamine-hydrolysing)
MCGILGYVLKGSAGGPSRERFERAVDALEHRGPDRRGTWFSPDGRVGLGFRRLSIIDLEGGDQPMANEDGSLHIVFNGEAYNFRELRARLESKGHRFATRSDTEAILHLYEERGEACAEDLRGMFAFALHDARTGTLFLARDRFGKKPLVWAETPAGFWFSSEIGALLEVADVGREADLAAVDAYLALQYVPSPRTAWAGVRRLPPASAMRVTRGAAAAPHRYWRLDWTPTGPGRPEEALEGFRARFEEAVRLRLVSDVPLGAFLSGGVDSTVTVAAMTRLGGRVKTFTVGFDDPRFDESAWAREAARRLGTEHHETRARADSLESLDPLLAKLGEPFADQSLLPTHLLSKFTRGGVTVALSGDGGDELFAGYKRYADLARAARLGRLGLRGPWLAASRLAFEAERLVNPRRRRLGWPRTALDRILPLGEEDRYLALAGAWPRAARASLWRRPPPGDAAAEWLRAAQAAGGAAGEPTRWQALDVEGYLTDDILRKVDTASMACSLECRCPLLDHEAAAYAASLPARFRLDARGRTKWLLKNLYPDLVPPSFFERKKKGFSMPIGEWMRRQWRAAMEEAVDGAWSPGLERAFDRPALRATWSAHLEGRADHGLRLWAWLALARWDRLFRPLWPETP